MEQRQIHIVGIHSGRRNGHTSAMIYEISQGCGLLNGRHPEWRPIRMTMEFFGLGEPEHDIPLLLDPETQKPEGAVAFLLEQIRKADGLILATPVRWGNMSAGMMRFLEWCDFFEEDWPLRGMPVAYAAHGEIDGGQAAIDAMQRVMMHLKCITPEDAHFYRIESLVLNAISHPALRWMILDPQLVGLRLAEAAYKRRYGA